MNLPLMFADPMLLADEWLMTMACCVVAFSCLLHLNNMGRGWARALEKACTALVGLGAFGLGSAPFFGILAHPGFFELAFVWGVSLFSIQLSAHCWMELPLLNRRIKPEHTVDIGRHEERRRGVPTDQEDRICSL